MENKYNYESGAGMIYLYRYACTFPINQDNKLDKDDPNVLNFLAILEKMKDKYDR